MEDSDFTKKLQKKLVEIQAYYANEKKDYYAVAINEIIPIYHQKISSIDVENKKDCYYKINAPSIANGQKIYEFLSKKFVELYPKLNLSTAEQLSLPRLLDIRTESQKDGTIKLHHENEANKESYETILKEKDLHHLLNKIVFTEHDKSLIDDYEKNSDKIKNNFKIVKEHDELIATLGKVLKENSPSDHQDTGWIKDNIDQIELNSVYSDKLLEQQEKKINEIEKTLSQAENILERVGKEELFSIQSQAFKSFQRSYSIRHKLYIISLIVSLGLYAYFTYDIINDLPSNKINQLLSSSESKEITLLNNNKIEVIELFTGHDLLYLLKWSLPSIIITTLLFQFLGLMKREMMTAQVMMESYRHKISMMMSSIGFKGHFKNSPKSEELILSEMIKALAHNPTDDLKQMQNTKQDMPIDKAFGVIDKGLDKIVTVKEKIDKSFNKKPEPDTTNSQSNNSG